MIALLRSPASSRVLLSSVSGFGGYAVIRTPPPEPPAWLRIYLRKHTTVYDLFPTNRTDPEDKVGAKKAPLHITNGVVVVEAPCVVFHPVSLAVMWPIKSRADAEAPELVGSMQHLSNARHWRAGSAVSSWVHSHLLQPCCRGCLTSQLQVGRQPTSAHLLDRINTAGTSCPKRAWLREPMCQESSQCAAGQCGRSNATLPESLRPWPVNGEDSALYWPSKLSSLPTSAPTISSTFWRCLYIWNVGMARTPASPATSCAWTLPRENWTVRNRPALLQLQGVYSDVGGPYCAGIHIHLQEHDLGVLCTEACEDGGHCFAWATPCCGEVNHYLTGAL